MRLVTAFFQLVRWPNLFFIALTQSLFYFCIIRPALNDQYYNLHEKLTLSMFFVLLLASLLIAAAGYIINDYFDINIDQVNKPHRMVIENVINRRWAILLHLLLTTAGVILSFWVGMRTSMLVFFSNVVCTLMLWFYSTTFKKKLLSGNVIISLLTAWTVMVLYFATDTVFRHSFQVAAGIDFSMRRIYKFGILYAGFAFIISLVREVVKDMEDREGDARYGCKTMPIVWGIPASKVFAGVWLVVLIGALGAVQFYILQLGWWLSAIYGLLLVILPLCRILQLLYKAGSTDDYHRLSTLIKWVMLTGILSMLFFKHYT